MNNVEIAENYLRQAKVRIRHAEMAFGQLEYPYVIRQSQEAVELALKGALRLVGVEPPKWHDVGPILKENADRFPGWFRENIDELARISRELRREREPSMYGDEETLTPPYKLYSKIDAEKALKEAEKAVAFCERLFREWTKEVNN